MIIIGGGLAGLSAGAYARASGFRTTLVEHNLALGGVCTAWTRGPYTIDGCIHWLTGGPFDALYEELGILPAVQRRVLDEWITYRSARDGETIRFTRDLDKLERELHTIAPEDASEIAHLIAGARKLADMAPPMNPRELTAPWQQLAKLWEMRHQLGPMIRFHSPLGTWVADHIKSPQLRRMFLSLAPAQVPAMFLAMVLGYLERGYLSRPVGGTARFRDAAIASYENAGGEVRLHSTVEEIVVDGKRAVGVRLTDGSILRGDVVISTSSLPETALRLLGGRFDADAVRERMRTWKYLGPIVLASFGVELELRDQPPLQIVDLVEPFDLGGATNDRLYLRISNDEPSAAPHGHVVVQALFDTDYDWWATRGSRYIADKDAIADIALSQIDRQIPGVREATREVDVSTPLTFWNMARSWRGAFEGWLPQHGSMNQHVEKTLGELENVFLAGQWVEPGGGVPTAILSGRQAAQLACAAKSLVFKAPVSPPSPRVPPPAMTPAVVPVY